MVQSLYWMTDYERACHWERVKVDPHLEPRAAYPENAPKTFKYADSDLYPFGRHPQDPFRDRAECIAHWLWEVYDLNLRDGIEQREMTEEEKKIYKRFKKENPTTVEHIDKILDDVYHPKKLWFHYGLELLLCMVLLGLMVLMYCWLNEPLVPFLERKYSECEHWIIEASKNVMQLKESCKINAPQKWKRFKFRLQVTYNNVRYHPILMMLRRRITLESCLVTIVIAHLIYYFFTIAYQLAYQYVVGPEGRLVRQCKFAGVVADNDVLTTIQGYGSAIQSTCYGAWRTREELKELKRLGKAIIFWDA